MLFLISLYCLAYISLTVIKSENNHFWLNFRFTSSSTKSVRKHIPLAADEHNANFLFTSYLILFEWFS